jgi:biopolymer transport protein TolQ
LRFLLTSFLLQEASPEGWDASILDAIARSGTVSKAVLVILLFFSVVSWAIIADRYFAMRRIKHQNGQFYRLFKKATSLNDLANTALRYRSSLFARMYLLVFNDIQQHGRNETASTNPGKTTALISHEVLDRAINRAGLSEQGKLEKNLSFLATTASATPFIGLFGTVWGIINAFESIAGARSTDLSVVAPGIAEALIATAMGLAAAIPAVIGYNYFVHAIRAFSSEMEEFSMEVTTFIERHQVFSK